jgi:hypothetical protein
VKLMFPRTLIEAIKVTDEELERGLAAEKISSQVQQLQNFLGMLQRIYSRMKNDVSAFHALSQNGIYLYSLEYFRTYQKSLVQLDWKHGLQHVYDKIEKINREHQENVGKSKQSWKDYVDAKVSQDINFLSYWNQLTLSKDENVRLMLEESQRLERVWPVLSDNISQLQTLKATCVHRIEQLDIPQEARPFLNKLRNGTAKLSDISEDIWEWLKDSGLMEKISLKIN